MSTRICGLLSYNCTSCTEKVNLEVRSNMTEKTIELWRKMFDDKICLNCHTEKHIPETLRTKTFQQYFQAVGFRYVAVEVSLDNGEH